MTTRDRPVAGGFAPQILARLERLVAEHLDHVGARLAAASLASARGFGGFDRGEGRGNRCGEGEHARYRQRQC